MEEVCRTHAVEATGQFLAYAGVYNEQASLTGMGFNYYNEKKELVKNTIFGSYKIVKNTPTDFRVQYTVNPCRVWSDVTPITGVDLLLSHVLGSDVFPSAIRTRA